VAAWGDDAHVDEQRVTYARRLRLAAEALGSAGVEAPLPAGAFYLWAPAPDGDAWALARRLAVHGGVLVSPGELYGPAGAGHIRVAVVQPEERIALVAERLAAAT
jgi:aspartate/methionine/tyrosine aminotransferase